MKTTSMEDQKLRTDPFCYMKHGLIILIFVSSLLALTAQVISSSLYSYDEADYMYATKLGLVANYTDTPTMSVLDFLRTGLTRGRDSHQSSALSELIRGTNSVDFYRHYHGPLYFYWLILAHHLGLDEHGMRSFTVFFPVCSLLIIYLGSLWVLDQPEATLAAIIGSALFTFSIATVRSMELAPHQAFVCCYLACLMFLSKTAATGNRVYFYCAAVAAALSCCLLEVGLVVVLTVLLCGYLERRTLRADRAFALRSLLAFTVTVLVTWPGAVLKLSFIKGYVSMAYLSLVRKSPFGHEGFLETWQKRICSSPIEWLVIAVALLILIFSHRRPQLQRHLLYPVLFYAALMLVVTLRVTSGTARYSLPFEPALDELAGWILATRLSNLRRPITAYVFATVLSLVLFTEALVEVKRYPVLPDLTLSSHVAYIRDNHLQGSRLVVPQTEVPTLHYYFPDLHLRGYTDQAPKLSTLLGGNVDGLLYPGLPVRYEPVSSR